MRLDMHKTYLPTDADREKLNSGQSSQTGSSRKRLGKAFVPSAGHLGDYESQACPVATPSHSLNALTQPNVPESSSASQHSESSWVPTSYFEGLDRSLFD